MVNLLKDNHVLTKIIKFVEERDDIRAAILNGSRVNPNAPKDEFQDYDVWLIVKDPTKYLQDQTFINYFGELIIKQVNPSPGEKLFYGEETQGLIFLMLFKEGFRIDLSFSSIEELNNEDIDDTLSLVLVDKDQLIPKLPEPSDKSYWIKKPQKDEYDFVVNEFFWCMTNVAKGLWREELPYVKGMYDTVVRRAYNQMIKWYIGLQYDWKVNVGSFGKWLKYFLPKDLYELMEQSYSGSNYNDIWDSLFYAIKLFRIISKQIATHLNFYYPIQDDENTTQYLHHVRSLHQEK